MLSFEYLCFSLVPDLRKLPLSINHTQVYTAMRIEISLQEGLQESLNDKLRRQIAFKIGAKDASVEAVRASLKKLSTDADLPWYVCNISAKLRNGEIHRAQIRSRQPNICIADTASRLARMIDREIQGQARWGSDTLQRGPR